MNDETFPAFAIFPRESKIYLSLAEESRKARQPVLVLLGTISSMIGFVFQFVGLRSLHWSVSVAQLVAMFITTGLRVFLHMPFSSALRCESLPSKYELEWLTYELTKYASEANEILSGPVSPATVPPFDLDRGVSIRAQLRGIASSAGWGSSFAVEALRLKDTIDHVMNMLWSDPDFKLREDVRSVTEFQWEFCTGLGHKSDSFTLTSKRTRRPGLWTPWNSSYNDIESVLALWLYKLHTRGVDSNAKDEDQEPHNISKRSIWNICPMTAEYTMDYDWWIRRGFTYFSFDGDQLNSRDEDVTIFDGMPLLCSPLCNRNIPLTSHSSTVGKLMAVLTHCSLAGLCIRYIFSCFLDSAFTRINRIDGTSSIRSAEEEVVPEIVRFEHTGIEKLAAAVSSYGLVNYHETYLMVVPCLRSRGLMPHPFSPVEDGKSHKAYHSNVRRTIHAHLRIARAFKHRTEWDKADEEYSKLLSWFGKRLVGDELSPKAKHSLEDIRQLRDKWDYAEVRLLDGDVKASVASVLGGEAKNNAAQTKFMAITGHQILPPNTIQRCADDLFDLDVALTTGFAHDLGASWIVEVLKLAMEHGRHAAVLLILLELMDEPSFKNIRGQLPSLAQHIMNSPDLYVLEMILLHSTMGRVVAFQGPGRTLTEAARYNNHKALKKLLQYGIPADTRDSDGYTALMVASAQGHLESAKQLIAFDAFVNAKPPAGHLGPLDAAVKGNHITMIEELLKSGASANPPHRSYGTPVQLAVVQSNQVIVEKLIQAGADVSYPGPPKGRTALQAAAEINHFGIVKVLLDSGSNVNEPATAEGFTALQLACRNGHTELVELLLSKGADVNAPAAPSKGLTALQAAALSGHYQIVLMLLRFNANVNANASIEGYSAIQAAALSRNSAIFNKLLEADADIKAPLRNCGKSVLQAACSGGCLDFVARLLLRPDVDVNETPAKDCGMTALQLAASGGHTEIVKILLDRQADVNAAASERQGRTALQAAAENGHFEIVKVLLNAQADIDARPSELKGFTALQAAARNGNISIVELLCEKGADIAASPSLKMGRTALQAAAERGHVDVVRYLLRKGSYANERPSWIHGVVAWQAAYANGHDLVASMLDQAGAKKDLEELGDTDVGDGWLTLYSAEIPQWATGTTMARASSPNGLPDTAFFRPRAHIPPNTNPQLLGLYERSALTSAAEAGDELLVEELLAAGHRINEQCCLIQGRNALQAAAEAGQDAVVAQLLTAGADVNSPRCAISGRTALEAASTGGHVAVVRRLVAAGAEVNPPDPPEGNTALRLAAGNGHLAVVKELIGAGADHDFVSAEVGALTALEAARENGYEEIVQILRL